MSRALNRVEPLPRPFVLEPARALASPLHGRLVVVAVADAQAAEAVIRRLAGHPGVSVGPGPSRLFADALGKPWGAFQLESDIGLAALLSAQEFLGLLRDLADALLAPALGDGAVLVEHSPEHADPAAQAVLASLYPDAQVVRGPGDVDAVLAALPHPSAGSTRGVRSTPPRLARDGLVVIVGAGRSGTTWLEELWLRHPRVGGLPGNESFVFHQLQHLWRNVEGVDGPGLGAWLDRPRFVRALRDYCDGVFAAALARHRPSADHYVEKSPVHAHRLPQIAAVYPDAWVVHLVRDGRDVARSMMNVAFFEVAGAGEAAAAWQRAVTTVRRDSALVRRFRELRYERLYADPAARMAELFGWTGLTADDATLAAVRAAAGARVSAHAGTGSAVGTGTWRSLPADELEAVYDEAGDSLRALGYVSRLQLWRARGTRRRQRGTPPARPPTESAPPRRER